MFNISQIPPSVNTDNKVSDNIHTRAVTEDGALASGVVGSVGDALSLPLLAVRTDSNNSPLKDCYLNVDGRKFALSITNVRTLAHALNVYLNNHIDNDWGWDDENNEKEIAVQYLTNMRNQFRNIQNYYSVEHQAWLEACENGSIHAESGIFDKAE